LEPLGLVGAARAFLVVVVVVIVSSSPDLDPSVPAKSRNTSASALKYLLSARSRRSRDRRAASAASSAALMIPPPSVSRSVERS